MNNDKTFNVTNTANRNVPAALTDRGCARELNEDRYAAIDSPTGVAWVVCDGMGGVQGGDLAAQLAVEAIKSSLEAGTYESLENALVTSIEEANRKIVLRRQNPAFVNMGTTIVSVIFSEREYFFAHAGDSRAYLIRGKEIQQLTTDHSYVQQLVEEGKITSEEALSHPQAHVLTRCVGADPNLKLDVKRLWRWNSEKGSDVILLCSDGLYSLISDSELVEHVGKYSPHECCVKLTELAKSRGGFDNITVAVLPVDGQLLERKPDDHKVGSSLQNKVKFKRQKNSVHFGLRSLLVLVCGLIGAAGTLCLMLMKYISEL